MTYVRNLGFEDTPDYDYLRDLFTQALKNAGEVEDGNYDWMKLNNGRGWEHKSSYSSQQHQQQQQLHSPLGNTGRDPHARVSRAGVTPDRLNAAQPPPPSPAKPGVGRPRDRPSASGGMAAKRASVMTDGMNVPTSSQPQFQSSNANPPARMSSPMVNSPQAPPQQGAHQASHESQPNLLQKMMKALCCGM